MKHKKLLSLILSIVIIALSVQICFAAEVSPFTYEITSENTATITGYSDLHEKNLKIPSELGGYPVTEIANDVFKGKLSLSTVTIPDTVISLGDMAFYGCKNISSVNIGASVKEIGDYCFNLCESLVSINLRNIEKIGEFAFYGCKGLTTLNCGNYITEIPKRAFSGCKLLTNITFSKKLKTIGDYAFANCISLTSLTFPNSLTLIGLSAFSNAEVLESVTFGNGPLTISGYAFENCPALLKIKFPETIEAIGRNAFALRDETTFTHAKDFEISCYSSCSPAIIYASEAGIDPYLIDLKKTVKYGNVDGDKKITTKDARLVLRASADLAIIDDDKFTFADVNLNGKIDIDDARIILRKAISQESK